MGYSFNIEMIENSIDLFLIGSHHIRTRQYTHSIFQFKSIKHTNALTLQQGSARFWDLVECISESGAWEFNRWSTYYSHCSHLPTCKVNHRNKVQWRILLCKKSLELPMVSPKTNWWWSSIIVGWQHPQKKKKKPILLADLPSRTFCWKTLLTKMFSVKKSRKKTEMAWKQYINPQRASQLNQSGRKRLNQPR